MINWLKKILNKSDDRAFIDRNVRIRLLNEDSVKLIAEDNRFSVMNLSGSGIGFLSEVRQLSVGDLLEASLSVEKKIV
ncbi:MAG: hypothetical protein M9962_10830, partial [Oligoflexia bacterium]|nr:hypothetical protein [Oligoflexia bacterium]